MASRLNVSWRAFSMSLGFLVALGVLSEVSKGHPLLNILSAALRLILVLASSVMLFIRMWSKRHNPVEFWRSSHHHSGGVSVLSAKWRRWVFGQDD
jgi:UDP-N-acetylmuramyl pentapeptide phosphotransferase/UDP-N-acetylglucosamine-1-phosphate transferase